MSQLKVLLHIKNQPVISTPKQKSEKKFKKEQRLNILSNKTTTALKLV